jgi:hypothetical protein
MHKTLHRDIFWLGRQWAVTGYGIQALDHKLEMRFDVAIERIGEDDPAGAARHQPWFDADDFADAIVAAKRRLDEPSSLFKSTFESEE